VQHLITLKDWSSADILAVVEAGSRLKKRPEDYVDALRGQTLALLFQKTSTRTRCAGEVGMTQLGGHALYLDWRATNFGLADMGDEIRVLSRYADFIVARLLKNSDIVRAADYASVPVMNGCCDRYHPMQGLTDLQTLYERFGRLEGLHLTYVGVYNNVCNSLIAAGLKVGMDITVVAPEINSAAEDVELRRQAEGAGRLQVTDDLRAALEKSNAVYTDTWIDMEYFLDPTFAEEKERRLRLFKPYQLNKALLEGLDDLCIMHCLPAHRGYEIDGELIDDPRTIVFDQAENRLHSQKAVLLHLAGKLG
jgi:ornithine carbamoyltransferase